MDDGIKKLEGLARDIARAMPELSGRQRRMARFIYRRLATGKAVAPETIAAHCGLGVADTRELLAAWPEVAYDAQGAVVSFWRLRSRRISVLMLSRSSTRTSNWARSLWAMSFFLVKYMSGHPS